MQERRLAAGTRGAIYTSRKGTAGQKGSAFSESIGFRECPCWRGKRTGCYRRKPAVIDRSALLLTLRHPSQFLKREGDARRFYSAVQHGLLRLICPSQLVQHVKRSEIVSLTTEKQMLSKDILCRRFDFEHRRPLRQYHFYRPSKRRVANRMDRSRLDQHARA